MIPKYGKIGDRGGSAFPLQKPEKGSHSGMDLHDWFTGVALGGLLANPKFDVTETAALSDIVELARHCAAEALRNKEQDYLTP